MTSSIIDKKKTKSKSKLLIFGFFALAIISTVVIYFLFFKSDNWLSQKTKSIEIGTDFQICDLVNCIDEVLVAYNPKPEEPYTLGKLEITFSATKGEDSKDITFTYTIVDTTAPVFEKINSQIAIGEEVDLSSYIKVTDNSGEELLSQVSHEAISTANLGDYSVELNIKDSSGNEAKYTFRYSVVDPTALAPNLPGTKKVLQYINRLNRVTYVAEEGNPYGVTAGVYVGEFKKEVTFEGVEVGGIVLIPKVVEKLLADRDGKAIFIPADISEIKNNDFVDLLIETVIFEEKDYKDYWVRVDTHFNEVSISNGVIGSETSNNFYITEEIIYDLNRGILATTENKNMYSLGIFGNFTFNEDFQKALPFGKKITETSKIFVLTLNPLFPIAPISKDDLLKVNNSIVFLKDIE